MRSLQNWMRKNRKLDDDVARAINLSRSQVSRIRRGKSICTIDTAQKLEKLTGIRWFRFLVRQ